MSKTDNQKNQNNNEHTSENGPSLVDDLELNAFGDSGTEGGEKGDKNTEKSFSLSKRKLAFIGQLAENIRQNSDKLMDAISQYVDSEQLEQISIGQMSEEGFSHGGMDGEEGTIIEGVFDGENMIGPDGKQYSVPANYASKSKLVEGDILKLTIAPNGTFVYKQIGPIDRARVVGLLEQSIDGNFQAKANGRKWRVLTASVTYFKGQTGDEVVILIPKTGESKWAAVENIVRKRD